jgi:transposase
MYHLGIGVHKDESHVAVLDGDGEVDREIRVENANLDEVAEEYAGSQAAIEATGNYYTIYDTLDEYLDVVVADPQQTKAIGTAEVKNDRLDAKLLAQLRRAGMIAQSYVPSEELRAEVVENIRSRRRILADVTEFGDRGPVGARADEDLEDVFGIDSRVARVKL